jgi:hypothetical protein
MTAARRYGHRGVFWRSNPGIPYRPITAWQVWNEPNTPFYAKSGKPNARTYLRLLRYTSAAVRIGDPRARIVLAGGPGRKDDDGQSGGGRVPLEDYLDRLLRLRGARAAFDVAAVHPYASTVSRVGQKIERVRRVMRRRGEGATPLWVTEVGWSSGGQREHELVKDPATQARLLREAFRMLRANRHRYGLGNVYWYRFQDLPHPCEHPQGCWEDHTGLFTGEERPKPAWEEFSRSAGGSPLAGPLPPDEADAIRGRLLKGIGQL